MLGPIEDEHMLTFVARNLYAKYLRSICLYRTTSLPQLSDLHTPYMDKKRADKGPKDRFGIGIADVRCGTAAVDSPWQWYAEDQRDPVCAMRSYTCDQKGLGTDATSRSLAPCACSCRMVDPGTYTEWTNLGTHTAGAIPLRPSIGVPVRYLGM
jgi:hypothetical protein